VAKNGLAKAELKAAVIREVDRDGQKLSELSLKIHANPEPAFRENKAAAWLADYLSVSGFRVSKKLAGLPTAFRASYGNGEPVIALLAEYDALPEVGHACGHNVIATSAVGAAVASRCVVDDCGGTVVVFGTPAEELFGGKIIMLRAGVFDGVDVAMMVHPGAINSVFTEALACVSLDVEFFGKAAHAAAYPERGINALEAMILAFNALDSLRQHVRDTSRIHGVINSGGQAPNIVPAYCSGSFLVRAMENTYLDELKHRVLNCFQGAALATGARLEYRWGDVVYAPMRNNLALGRLFAQNLQSLGRKVESFEPRFGFGSTDMGNVSQIIPAIHAIVAIATPDILLHSSDFAHAASSEAGYQGILDSAKAMAMTVVDLLSEPEALATVKEEFLA
jgi:amidohydrolase